MGADKDGAGSGRMPAIGGLLAEMTFIAQLRAVEGYDRVNMDWDVTFAMKIPLSRVAEDRWIGHHPSQLDRSSFDLSQICMGDLGWPY